MIRLCVFVIMNVLHAIVQWWCGRGGAHHAGRQGIL
jgi:hypothetical protein